MAAIFVSQRPLARGRRSGRLQVEDAIRHREERIDAAIQDHRSSPSSLDRFACARDDGHGPISRRVPQFAP